MQLYNDNYKVYDRNHRLEIALISTIGERNEQQDCAGYEFIRDEGLAVVCDGMGGMECGRQAAAVGVETMLEAYKGIFAQVYDRTDADTVNPHTFLVKTAEDADSLVAGLIDSEGHKGTAGSTMVAVLISGQKLYWISVGDSRIYFYRNREMVRVTTDHTYQAVLDEQLSSGKISREEYESELYRGKALVSYLGVNGMQLIDANDIAFGLEKNDRLLLLTDGFYRLVSDEELRECLENNIDINDAAMAIEQLAMSRESASPKDNRTMALLEIKQMDF